MTATSAEISVIRRPRVTRCSQDVLIEEEEEEDDEDQSSFQSCTSSILEQAPSNDQMDSRLTEVGRQEKGTSRGEVDTGARVNSPGNRMNASGQLGTEIGFQSRFTQGEVGSNTPSQKCPTVAGVIAILYRLVFSLAPPKNSKFQPVSKF